MSTSLWFSRLPRQITHLLYPLIRYASLMRALELRLLMPWVRDVKGWRALDVGCGHGFYSLEPARRGADQVGCDLDRPSLASARKIAGALGLDSQTLFLAADGTDLPLSDQSFDLVVCNCVLEHVGDDGAALAAMARSLRAGGILYLTVDNAEHGSALGLLDRLPAAAKHWLLWPQVASAETVARGLEARLDDLYAVLRRYHADELTRVLGEMGLTILDCRPYLTGIGGAHYEAFHAVRFLDPAKNIGRVLYTVSSLLLYPLAAWADNRKGTVGHGLSIVARKEGEGSA
jgi:SAM-dependent methyltransferase